MARPFRATRAGVQTRLDGTEVLLLRGLFGDLLTDLESLGGDPPADPLEQLVGSQTPTPPGERGLARLFPDAYDDAEASAEFRAITQDDLRGTKLAAVRAVLHQLEVADSEPLLLDAAGVEAWLGALNDLRLVLGTRQGVTEDSYDEADRLPPTDPRVARLAVYHWLSELLEGLVRAAQEYGSLPS